MDTDDLIFCYRCGVYHHIQYVKRFEPECNYEVGFYWECSICKHKNYEED